MEDILLVGCSILLGLALAAFGTAITAGLNKDHESCKPEEKGTDETQD